MKFVSKKYFPRWLIFFMELSAVLITFFFAYILRFNFDLILTTQNFNPVIILLILPIYVIIFTVFKTYSGIIRHSTTHDIARVLMSLFLGAAIISFISFLTRSYVQYYHLSIPFSVSIIQFALASLTIVSARLVIKNIYNEWFTNRIKINRVLIFGAGRLGQITRNALLLDTKNEFKIVGFIDDNQSLQNKYFGACFPHFFGTPL